MGKPPKRQEVKQEWFPPRDVAAMFGWSQETARKYMRKMIHKENPLLVSRGAIEAWLNKDMHSGEGEIKPMKQYRTRTDTSVRALPARFERRKA